MLPLLVASAQAAALNPVDAATLQSINICAGAVRVQQDPRFATVLPKQEQTLPLRCAADKTWTLWLLQHPAEASSYTLRFHLSHCFPLSVILHTATSPSGRSG